MPDREAGRGTFIAIVGPSGAGKDTILRGVKTALAGDPMFIFARRIITRASDAHEEHDTLTPEAFHQMETAGGFLLTWHANSLAYGLPAALALPLAGGRHVIANISRAMVEEVRARFRPSFIIEITAAPDVLATRLAARGREDAAMQIARLERGTAQSTSVTPDARIENNTTAEAAVDAFLALLHRLPLSASEGL